MFASTARGRFPREVLDARAIRPEPQIIRSPPEATLEVRARLAGGRTVVLVDRQDEALDPGLSEKDCARSASGGHGGASAGADATIRSRLAGRRAVQTLMTDEITNLTDGRMA